MSAESTGMHIEFSEGVRMDIGFGQNFCLQVWERCIFIIQTGKINLARELFEVGGQESL